VPELPEVETVARDLRALVVGATIVGASCDWPAAIATHDPDTAAANASGGAGSGSSSSSPATGRSPSTSR
jgi:formamidopyrimidine-DNA glycosylase